MYKPTIDEIKANIETIYSAPVVLDKLTAAINQPDVDVAAVEFALKNDPSFMARLIKVANSSYYGSTSICTAKDAIVMLGFDLVKNIVIQVAVKQLVDRALNKNHPFVSHIWKHSIAVAVCARLLAKELSEPQPEIYFTSGILHDVGILIEFINYQSIFIPVPAMLYNSTDEVLRFENNNLGFDHIQIGRLFSEHWRLPVYLIDKIAHHHDPRAAGPDLTLSAGIMRLSDLLSIRLGNYPYESEPTAPELEALDLIGSNTDLIKSILPYYFSEYTNSLTYFS